MDVWFAGRQQCWVSGAYGTLFYIANGGRNWAVWSHKLASPGTGTVLAYGLLGTIYRSTDRGQS